MCPDGARGARAGGVQVCQGEQFHALYYRSACQGVQAHPGLPGAVLAQCRSAVEQVPVRAFHVFVLLFCAGQVQRPVQPALSLEQKCLLCCCDCGLQVLRQCFLDPAGCER